MIEIKSVTKNFEKIKSLDDIKLTVSDGSIFGLIGSNGSGKSTLLKIICGVYKTDEGGVEADGEEVWENTNVKKNIVYLSDEQFFMPHSTTYDMMKLYKSVYPTFNDNKYREYLTLFEIDERRKLSTFSKGMKKQAAAIIGLACDTKYLLCDEILDGLDAVMRRTVCKIVADEVSSGEKSIIFASHNLKEIEDICDHVGLLHKGQLLFETGLDNVKLSMHKVQISFDKERVDGALEEIKKLDVISVERRGSLITALLRGDERQLEDKLSSLCPSFMEFIPMTLEEIFIAEMGDRGYDVK